MILTVADSSGEFLGYVPLRSGSHGLGDSESAPSQTGGQGQAPCGVVATTSGRRLFTAFVDRGLGS